MARSITQNAQITLTINAKQVQDALTKNKTKAEELRKKIDELTKAGGDPKEILRLNKELWKTEEEIRKLNKEIRMTNEVLMNLDKASPKQLRNTLRTLTRELNAIPRGTQAWETQMTKIRLVRAEIDRMNASMRSTETGWDRVRGAFSKAQGMVMAGVAAAAAAIAAMNKSVEDYASMDQEMAGVRKYSGISESDVRKLNDRFRQIDTRTSREELNKLAQDAGRLGKQSVEDIMGFTRAAMKVNVALDDLGDGATLTLSKLTGIFGDEERLGTEKSLLALGSVINELSQNCSASAPYLAEFASRMGSVAVQAGLTSSQVMAYGAVLDANNQKVEAASTALSQIMMRLFQDPAKYAKVAGLDVQEFTNLVRTDMNSALLELLSKLNEIGRMDILAPMFKDMGENGSRAQSALATLASKIDDVRKQQEVANRAFRDANSIDKEYEVQNNTKQAALEKAKGELHELSVELGEQLYPVMTLSYKTTALFTKGMNMLVGFVMRNKVAILALVAAISAYNVAVNAAAIKTAALTAVKKAGIVIATAWRAVILLCQAAALALSGNITRATAAMKLFNTTVKMSPIGLLVGLIAAATVKMIEAATKTDEFTKALDEAEKEAYSFTAELQKERKEIDRLFGTLQGAKRGTEEYNKAKETIISRYGVYLQGLITEQGEINNLTLAYNRLTWAAGKSAQARSIERAKDKLLDTFGENIDNLTEELRVSLEKMGMAEKDITRIVTRVSQSVGAGGTVPKDIRQEIFKFESGKRDEWDVIAGNQSAVGILNRIMNGAADYSRRVSKLNAMDTRYFATMDSGELDSLIKTLTDAQSKSPIDKVDVTFSVKDDNTANAIGDAIGSKLSTANFPLGTASATLDRSQSEKLLRELMYEKSMRTSTVQNTPSITVPDTGDGYVSATQSAKEQRKAAAEARKEALKAKQEFKDGLEAIQAGEKKAMAELITLRATGGMTYREYVDKKREIEDKYFDDSLKYYRTNLSAIKDINYEEDKDYQELCRKKAETAAKYQTQIITIDRKALERSSKFEQDMAQIEFDSRQTTMIDEIVLQEKVLAIKVKYLEKIKELYDKNPEEQAKIEEEIVQIEEEDKLKKREVYYKKTAELQKKYLTENLTEIYKMEEQVLKRLLETGNITQSQYEKMLQKLKQDTAAKLPGNQTAKSPEDEQAEKERKRQQEIEKLNEALKEGIITQEEYEKRMKSLQSDDWSEFIAGIKGVGGEWSSVLLDMGMRWKEFADSLSDGMEGVPDKLASVISSSMAVFSAAAQMATQFAQANAKIEMAAIEERYDREIQLAQGNSRLISRLEKEKEEKLAEEKNKASKQEFKMQVISAIAQTAQNALLGFGAGLKAPFPMNTWLPAALAAAAVAQGAVQLALIQKQQEAAMATGYAEGGFTKSGDKYEVAGVVHAGEWVASQRLLKSPVARPIIDMLDQAQRSNTIGSLTTADVTAMTPAGALRQSMQQLAPAIFNAVNPVNGNWMRVPAASADTSAMADVLDRLAARLEEPFVTINTMTGDHGIKQVQDEYDRYINNKNRLKK